VRVLIVADVGPASEALTVVLQGRGHHCQLAPAADPVAIRTVASRYGPEVALVDMRSTAPLVALMAALESEPCPNVIALGGEDASGDLLRCVDVGVAGYLPSGTSLDTLCQMLTALDDLPDCGASAVVPLLLPRGDRSSNGRVSLTLNGSLTQREQQIAELLDQGFSNVEIARRLQVSLSTVKTHVHNILGKLGVARRGQIAAQWRRATRHEL
jgi:two-component system nitrate/nitrite response regulator NarL